MIGEAELGEGSEELATAEPIVLFLVVERDQDVVTEAKTLQQGGWERPCCDRETKILVGGGVTGGGVGGRGAHSWREEGG
jgi:hypothetical protein